MWQTEGGDAAVVRVLCGPSLSGHLIRLDKEEIVLGRSPDCDAVFPFQAISRWHCRILRRGRDYVLEDRGSRNGTALNYSRLDAPAVLQPGDRIVLPECGADVVLSFERPFDESLRAWEAGTIVRLAEAALDGVQEDSSLDGAGLLVLADALTDAGADEGLIDHLRRPGPHFPGCWAIEAVLGMWVAPRPDGEIHEGTYGVRPKSPVALSHGLAAQRRSPSGCWALGVKVAAW